MFFRKNECEKFRYLVQVQTDEPSSLSPGERTFTVEHPLRCSPCCKYEQEMKEIREKLRETASELEKFALDAAVKEDFVERVLHGRRKDLQSHQIYGTQLALVGAVTGVVVFLLLVQLLTIQPKIHQGDPTGTARIDRATTPFTIFEVPPEPPETLSSNDG